MPNDLLAGVDRLASADRRSRAFVIVEMVRGHVGGFPEIPDPPLRKKRVAVSDKIETPTIKKSAKAIAAKVPKTTVASAVKKSTAWFMSEKCPHGWVNSATCEKNDGGCVR